MGNADRYLGPPCVQNAQLTHAVCPLQRWEY